MEERNMEQLVEAVTLKIMERLSAGPDSRKRILVLGKDPDCPIADCLSRSFDAEVARDLKRAGEYDFVVLPVSYLERLGSGKTQVDQKPEGDTDTVDLRDRRLLHERELRERCAGEVRAIRIGKGTILTSLAADFIRQRGIRVLRED